MTDNKWKNSLQDNLTRVRTEIDVLRNAISALGELLKENEIPIVLNDYLAIEKSLDQLLNLTNNKPFSFSDSPEKLLDTLRTYRHDLRAACGGIIGYTELIQEEYEDQVINNETIIQSLEYVISLSQALLGTIESLKVDDQDVNKSTSTQKIQITKNPATVLIIDDNLDKAKMLQRRVEQIGHSAFVALDGHSGLHAVEQKTPDIILLDLIMPDISGLEVLKKIKASVRHQTIPVLMISSSSDMTNITQCILEGADDYLPTPVNNILLYSRIESCITKKLAHDQQQKAMKELSEARHILSTAIESIDEGFVIFDNQDCILTYNTNFENLYPAVKSLKKSDSSYEDFLRVNISCDRYSFERRQTKRKTGDNIIDPHDVDAWISRMLAYHREPKNPQLVLLKDGRWIEVIENNMPFGGSVGIHKDVSDRKRHEEKLEFLALHDPLTGLMNRKNYENCLERVHNDCLSNNEAYGVLFFDLDGFKAVNDTLGHDYGDFLLKEVANKLTKCLRTNDYLARLGGDEFIAIITDNCPLDDLKCIANRCLKAVGTQVNRNGQIARFGISIGIARYPDHGSTTEEILKNADEAMYRAKKDGKGVFKIAL